MTASSPRLMMRVARDDFGTVASHLERFEVGQRVPQTRFRLGRGQTKTLHRIVLHCEGFPRAIQMLDPFNDVFRLKSDFRQCGVFAAFRPVARGGHHTRAQPQWG